MKLPVFFELDGKFAAMLPASDGGISVVKDPVFSIADFMAEGSVISRKEVSESFERSLKFAEDRDKASE